MPELTREEKLKLVEKLPERLQEFLYSEDTGVFLLYLGKKYNLSDEKVSALSKITTDIILKIIPITSLAQEVAGKVVSDHQAAMSIAQELNTELLAPVLMPTPAAPTAPVLPTTPAPTSVYPAAPTATTAPPAPAAPRADQYREQISGPEIIDLRKTPPPPMQMPVAAAPIPPRPTMTTPPITPKPLTFTKPLERPFIESEPHGTPAPVPTPQPSWPPVVNLSNQLIEAEPHQKEEIKIPEPPKPPVVSKVEPQFIVRPPGLSPTDFHSNVLDLRKDKGEF